MDEGITLEPNYTVSTPKGLVIMNECLKICYFRDKEGQFDKEVLHRCLTNVRNWRYANQTITTKQLVGIQIYWVDENKCITVLVEGSSFEVIGYYKGLPTQGNSTYVSFGDEGILRYLSSDGNVKAAFQMDAVYNYLECLSQYTGSVFPHNELFNNSFKGRYAFLMCVFLTSEIVRNEILEVIFLYQDIFPCGKWNEYEILYQNWNRMSQIIKPKSKTDKYIETITVKDVWKMWESIKDKDDQERKASWADILGGIHKTVIDLYDDILVNIKNNLIDSSSFKEMYKIN